MGNEQTATLSAGYLVENSTVSSYIVMRVRVYVFSAAQTPGRE
jgi:hypothetical protein